MDLKVSIVSSIKKKPVKGFTSCQEKGRTSELEDKVKELEHSSKDKDNLIRRCELKYWAIQNTMKKPYLRIVSVNVENLTRLPPFPNEELQAIKDFSFREWVP